MFFFNEAILTIFGRSDAELTRDGYIQFITEATRQRGQAILRQVQETGEPVKSYEFEIIRPDGEVRTLESSVGLIRLEDGSPAGFRGIVRDVTERKQAERRLRERDERFRALVENGFDGISLQDAEGLITYVSPAYKRILGYEPAEVVGKKPFAQIHPDEVKAALQARDEIRQTPGVRRTLQFRTKHKNGDWRWLEVTLTNLLDEPSVRAIVINFRDITEQQQQELALRQSEERFRAIWDNAMDGMLIVNDDMQYVDANPAACALYGVTREELIRRSMADFVTAEKRQEARRSLTKLIRLGERKGHFHLRRPDHSIREIEYNARANFLPGLHLSMMRDVTERNRAEEALRASEEHYRSLVSVLEEGVLMLDVDGNLLTCNESAERILGATREELHERGIINPKWCAIREDGSPLSEEESPVPVTLRTGRPCSGVVVGVIRPAGDLRWLSISSQPVFLQDGKSQEAGQPQAVVVSISDITERKLAETALRESEALFATAFDASPVAVSLTELPLGTFDKVNQAWCKLFSYTADEVRGKTSLELGLWRDLAVRTEFFQQLDKQGAVWEYEAQLCARTGELRHALISAKRLELGQKQYVLTLLLDITERKLAEERFAKAFNANPNPMSLIRLADQCYVQVNAVWAQISGYTPAEVTGRTVSEFNHWIEPARRDEFYRRLAAQGRIRDFEARFRAHDGEARTFLLSGELIEINGEQHFLINGSDITERKRSEEALRASEERFARAFNSSPQPIVIASLPEGRFIALNQAWTKTFGYTPEEAIGQTSDELGLWVKRSQRRRMAAMIGTLQAVRDLEVTFRTKQGELCHLILSGEVIRLAGESYLLLTCMDVTARKQAELALRDTEERYRLLFERNLAGVYRVTVDGQYLDCNKAYAAMFGYDSPAEIMAAGPFNLYPDPRIREQMLEELRQHGSLTDYEVHLQRKDGSEIWGLANVTLLESEHGAPAICEGIVLDITKRKHDEEKLAESREQLRALSARLSAIREEERAAIAREIHDSLGQMLTGLKLDVSWLHKRLSGLTAEPGQTFARKTESMGELLDNTIQAVRDLATRLRPGVLDTLGLTAAIEWQVQDFQARTNIECEVWLCPEPKDLPKEKAIALFRILQEILTNIIRHAEATRVVIHLLPAEGALLLSVADNGRGITTGSLRDANSLGLLGMRERALMVGGEVKFEGAPDRGTTVTVTVPL
jgi:PAS domain S-box-containing protein